jgi:hypothetical protein
MDFDAHPRRRTCLPVVRQRIANRARTLAVAGIGRVARDARCERRRMS